MDQEVLAKDKYNGYRELLSWLKYQRGYDMVVSNSLYEAALCKDPKDIYVLDSKLIVLCDFDM